MQASFSEKLKTLNTQNPASYTSASRSSSITSLPSPSARSSTSSSTLMQVRESETLFIDTSAHTSTNFYSNNDCCTKSPNTNTHDTKSVQGKGRDFQNENDIIVMKETENRVTEILSTVFSPDDNSDSNKKSGIAINSDKKYFEEEIIDESFFHRKEHEDFLLNFSKGKEEILDLFSRSYAKNFFLQELDERRSRNGLLSSRGFVVMTMIMEVSMCVCVYVCICVCVCVCVCVYNTSKYLHFHNVKNKFPTNPIPLQPIIIT